MKQGIILVNLGTSEDLTQTSIATYLTEFLLDRNVVDLPSFFWRPLLTKIIIPKRLATITKHYSQIWNNAHNKSPLLYYCESLVNNLNQTAKPNIVFDLAMTYGKPDIETTVKRLLQNKQCEQITILPLYPQYSTTTTRPIQKQIKKIEQSLNSDIALIEDYHDHPAYINALCTKIESHFKKHFLPDILLLSYHGIPLRYIKKRQEPYVEHCQETTKLIKEQLYNRYPNLDIQISFQSQFGKGKWTSPSTNYKLIEYAEDKKSVAVMCPGFAVDCLETLYEIEIENRALYFKHQGTEFSYIPALNDSSLQLNLISKILEDKYTR